MNDATNTTSVLVIMRGLPGSGKSYVAEAVRQQLGPEHVVMLDPDAIDYTSKAYQDFSAGLAAEGVDEKIHPFRFSREAACLGIMTHKVIIWTQAFTNQPMLDRLIKFLEDFAAQNKVHLPVLVVEVAIDLETAKKRVAERAGKGGHDVTAENFERFMADYTSFASYGYTNVSLNGGDDAAVLADKITEAIAAAQKPLT